MKFIRLFDLHVLLEQEADTLLSTIGGGVDLTAHGYAEIQPVVAPSPTPGYVIEPASPVEENGQWFERWEQRLMTPDEQTEQVQTQVAQYAAALDTFLDSTAQADRWDNRITCALRAGYPNPWQERAIAFGTWMDACYTAAYQIMDDVLNARRAQPTIEEFLTELPVFEWTAVV